ncbi:MAG: diguanylate cyclase [Planctomycetales bacterium]|nr:diguanylate cyclase [Planctomycetales bacterium]
MGAILFKIIFLGAAACLGAIAGWWIRGASGNREENTLPEPNSTASKSIVPTESVAEPDEEPQIDAVEVMMAQLQQLTATVAADVGEHNSKVREINDELTAATEDGTNVLAVVEKLVKANEAMQSQLAQAESRLNEQAQEIEAHVKDARTDALTKLWNRRHFDDEMQKCKDALTKTGRPSCVMMLDVDHFKKFNDTYGHQAGDEVLKGVARTIKKAAGKDIVCRYGGEEFAIILPGSDVNAAVPIAEKARAAIADQVFEFEDLDLKVTASGGLAELRGDETAAEVVKRADDALYVCKENGRNCGYWHDGAESHPMKDFSPAVPESIESFDFNVDEVGEDPRDRISGLSDQVSFRNDIDRRIAEWKRGGATLSVLLVEVDKYDAILDAYGDKAREVVLRAAAQFLKAAMREMDHIARYDDHIFGLLLPGAEVTETSSVAERLRTAIARCSLPLNGEKVTFTVSLGSAEVTENDTDATLLARAETSLEAAKRRGGNCSFAATSAGDVRSMALSP